MRWANHKLTSGALVYAATGNAMATGVALAGVLLPDLVEWPLREVIKHRGLSHWPYPYLGLVVLLGGVALLFDSYAAYYLMYLPLGGLLHLVEDALSPGGIPLKGPFSQRQGLNLYRPFEVSETLVCLGWLLACAAVAGERGFLSASYLVGEGHRVLLLLEYFGRISVS